MLDYKIGIDELVSKLPAGTMRVIRALDYRQNLAITVLLVDANGGLKFDEISSALFSPCVLQNPDSLEWCLNMLIDAGIIDMRTDNGSPTYYSTEMSKKVIRTLKSLTT